MIVSPYPKVVATIDSISDLVNRGTDTIRETRKPIRLDCL